MLKRIFSSHCEPLNRVVDGTFKGINLLRQVAWRSPAIYRRFGLLRRGLDVADLGYDLTVEGYPRSANTFITRLLEITNPHLSVRSHRHLPPFVIGAIQAGVPVLFLLREPRDCITSWCIMQNGASVLPQLAYYIAYHRALLPWARQMFIARFRDVTLEPTRVLSRFGGHYQLELDSDFDDAELQHRVFARIDSDNMAAHGEPNPRSIHRPTAARAAWKRELLEDLESPRNRAWLAEANALYAEFCSCERIPCPGYVAALA